MSLLQDTIVCLRKQLDEKSLHITGCAVPLSALRYEEDSPLGGDQGIGDFGAITHLIPWMVNHGQRVLQLLPVNDTTLYRNQKDAYPYSAISAFALNPIYADLNQLPLNDAIDLQKEANRLHHTKELHYGEVLRLKEDWLHKYYVAHEKEISGDSRIDTYIRAEAYWLRDYATFCYFRDTETSLYFHNWRSKAVPSEESLRYYYWVQWLLEDQLTEAVTEALSKGIVLKGDLPIGVSPYGADVRQHPELFYQGMQAGAPPDYFSQEGQNWGFPTYNWQAMEDEGYIWWKQRIKRLARFFAFLRIDHILGFFRIWSIPRDGRKGSMGYFVPLIPLSKKDLYAEGIPISLIDHSIPPCEDALILPYPNATGNGYTLRYNLSSTRSFQQLDGELQKRLTTLEKDFFYHRQEALWKENGTKHLQAIAQDAPLILCAEDLGLTPQCVYEVLADLGIMTLELERFSKKFGKEFSDATLFPYLSVATTGTHDMPPLRKWWHEDPQRAERFKETYSLPLQPDTPETTIFQTLINRTLDSPAALTILPLQDWLSVDPHYLEVTDYRQEQINYPEDQEHSWLYRLLFAL